MTSIAGRGGPLTPRDLPSTAAVDARLERLDREEAVLLEENTGTFRADLRTIGLVSGGVALVSGLAAGLLAARSGASLAGSAKIGGAIAAGGGMVVASAMAALRGTGGQADIADRLDAIEERQAALRAERTPDSRIIETGVDTFNAYTAAVFTVFDHDRDGTIDLRPGQAIDTDERIVAGRGAGPVREESDYVYSLAQVLRPADAAGNGDLQVDPREFATHMMRLSRADPQVLGMMESDSNEATYELTRPVFEADGRPGLLYSTLVHHFNDGTSGDARDFRAEASPE